MLPMVTGDAVVTTFQLVIFAVTAFVALFSLFVVRG